MEIEAKKTREPSPAQMREKWSALTDGDLEGITGKKEPLAGKLQERYGYGKEQAEREAEEFLRLQPEAKEGDRPNQPQQAPPLPPAPIVQPVSKVTPEVLPPSTSSTPVEPSAGSEVLAPAVYNHAVTIRIGPRFLQWAVPVLASALFIFLFLPWTGAYPGGHGVYTQSAFQTIWGGVSIDPVGVRALDAPKPYDAADANSLMLLFAVLVILALVLAVGPLVVRATRIEAGPSLVRFLSRWRLEALGLVALTALLVLIVQLGIGFGLEAAVEANIDKTLASEITAAKTPEAETTVEIHRALLMGPFHFGHTIWLRLAVICQVLLVVSLALQFWLKRRGSRPLPRIDAQA